MIPKTVGLIVFEQWPPTSYRTGRGFFPSQEPTGGRSRVPLLPQITLGVSTEPCATERGVIIKPQMDINDAPPLDTVIPPAAVAFTMRD